VAYTRGLQEGEDSRYLQAVVTLKHWDAYSLEDAGGFTRHNFNAKVSDYMLSSTYWPAWKASVQEGKAKGVMCSYLLRSILAKPPRDGWQQF
jgi:beta-D-xylosidase 4